LLSILASNAGAEPRPDSAAEQIRKYNESLDKATKQLPPNHTESGGGRRGESGSGSGGGGGNEATGARASARPAASVRPAASAELVFGFPCEKEIREAKALPKIVLVSDVSDSPEAEPSLKPSFQERLLAIGIADLYCKENLKSGLPLEIKTPLRNANGVAELLSKKSEGKISIEKKSVSSGFPLLTMEKMINDLLNFTFQSGPPARIPFRTGEVPGRDPFERIGMPDYGGSDGPPYRYNYTKPFEYGEASGELPPDNEKP